MSRNSWKLSEPRSILSEQVPLQTPFLVIIDTANVCNFKCKFCFQSLPKSDLKNMGFKPKIMDFDLYKKAVDDILAFPDKVKRLYLFAHGESLLNKDLPKMIAYAKEKNVADIIQITTNASLLTPKLNKELIEAGLDELRISIEGLTSEKYREVAGIDFDFNELLKNIEDFYIHRENCKLYIKAINIALDAENDESKFYQIFENMADNVSVEYLTPYYTGVDYSGLKPDYDKGILGDKPKDIQVCSRIFFQLYITPNGNVPICNADNMEQHLVGNITEQSLFDIWNGEKFREQRFLQLSRKRMENPFCAECISIYNCTREEDILDHKADELLQYFK